MHDRYFESKPEVMGGKLCFRGTRVPVATVLEVIDAGWDDGRILDEYPGLEAGAVAHVRTLATDPAGGWVRSRVA